MTHKGLLDPVLEPIGKETPLPEIFAYIELGFILGVLFCSIFLIK